MVNPFDVTKIGIGVGAGVVDDQMEKWDIRKLRTGTFKTAVDLSRVGGVVVGYGIQMFMRGSTWQKLGDALAQSYLPLLTRSIIKAVSGTTAAAGYTAQTQARMASWRAAQGRVSQTTTPQFKDLHIS